VLHHEGDGLTGEGGGVGNVQLSVLRISMSNFCLILKLIKLPKSSVADPEWIRIQWGPWIRIRIQEGKNDPKKLKIKFQCWMFSFEG
jgi:hypothetical protein